MKPGRKSKLTPEVQQRICDDIRLGISLRMAAEGAGIGLSTLFKWMNVNTARHRRFREEVQKARRDRTAQLLATIQLSARSKIDTNGSVIKAGDAEMALKLLERIEPQDFAQRVKMQVDSEIGEAVERLKHELRDEPKILLRVLRSIAAEETHVVGNIPARLVEDDDDPVGPLS